MTEKCDKCGKEFDSERGLHIHQAQKHKEESEESEAEDTGNQKNELNDNLSQGQQGLTLSIKQVGYGSFAVGLLVGLLLGGIFLGSLGSNMETVGLPSADNDGAPSDNGGSGGNVVELSNTEFPYEGLEAGVGEGERTFGDTTINVDGEPYIGSPDAEVTAVSYEDFECPFCSRYNQNAYPQIVENYVQTGEVQYFFKNLPLPANRRPFHKWAEPSAIASECALNQDEETFWTFKAGFFNNQEALGQAHQSGNFDESMYRWAEQTGLDTDQFRTCYDNEEELEEVNQDKTEAGNNGASATPSIFINDELISGAQPYSRFESVIESKLG